MRDFIINKGPAVPKISYDGEDARSGKMSYERGNRLPFERRQLPKDFRANYERPLRDEVVNNLPGEKERGKSVVNTPSIKIMRPRRGTGRARVRRKTTGNENCRVLCILHIKVK